MGILKKTKFFLLSIILLGFWSNIYGQDSTNLPIRFGEINVGYLAPDGQTRLVRGNRKIVTTDMLNTFGFSAKFGYKISKTRYATFSINSANITYELKEDYTGGLKIYSDDDFSITAFNIGLQQYFGKSDIRLYGAVNVGYVIFLDDIDLLGEEYLNPLPENEIVVYPYKYKTHNYVGFGIDFGIDLDITEHFGFVIGSSLYMTEMRASLVDDPEDDGIDIESSANSLSFSVGMKYSFKPE